MNKAKFTIATKGIIINKGKILLLRRECNDTGGGSWEYVGGSMEYGETPITALRREIIEETGLNDIKIIDILYATTLKKEVIIIAYLCESITQEVTLSEEHEEYCWVDKKKMMQLLPGHIKDDLIINDVLSRI